MTHFQRFGCEARIACNGKMAMLEAGDFMLEVILLDYHLPDMNGPTRGAARPAKAPTAHPMATGDFRYGRGYARRADGFTYFGVLLLIMVLGLRLGGACEIWSVSNQRAQERQLLWVGTQCARALKTYYEQSLGARQYPQKLEDLL